MGNIYGIQFRSPFTSCRKLTTSVHVISFLLLSFILLLQVGCRREEKLEDKKSGSSLHKKSPPANTPLEVASVALPGNRAYYTVAVMGGSYPNVWCRIAQYTFTAGAGSTGTVSEQFKYWNQNFSGGVSTWKTSSGYTTTGCTNTCTVMTPTGFEPAASWSTLSGTYYFDVNQRLVITWSSGDYETWTLSSPKTYYTKMVIFNSNYDVRHGYGYGSTSNLSTYATTTQMIAGGNLTDVDWYTNDYSAGDIHICYSGCTQSSYLALSTFQACNTGVIRIPQPGNPCSAPNGNGNCPTGGDYKSYIASSSTGAQNRKTYWQHQRGDVGCYESCQNACISSGGGHTMALLQVIDDNGTFRGYIGVEASLGPVQQGGRIIGAFYLVQP